MTKMPLIFLEVVIFIFSANAWGFQPIQSCTFNAIPAGVRVIDSEQNYTVVNSETTGAKAQIAIQRLKANAKTINGNAHCALHCFYAWAYASTGW